MGTMYVSILDRHERPKFERVPTNYLGSYLARLGDYVGRDLMGITNKHTGKYNTT